ncbi:pleckstrin homology-like domain family A member 2 [Protopterus annectens]|uniref:pleckstrin homology-like domain family A member 2 n=1 Tax=Protopterus annectens TaxID=7888 RepID=UPI001CFAC525|nr:pleckstrin homology-like domain family A member 2 [Protopterus annectens]
MSPKIGDVLKEGPIEKRSDSFLQLWKKKWCVLTKEGLHLLNSPGKKCGKCKALTFCSIDKVECVERKGSLLYFTVVTTSGQEIDFRCEERTCWNAEITLALVRFQNEKAVQVLRARKEHERGQLGHKKRMWSSR